MPNEALHIASLLVHARPAQRQEVAQWLAAQPECEVSAEDASGKLVVVVESLREVRILELIDALQLRPGVLGAVLVYHQVLDPASADELADSIQPQATAEGVPT
ncbi:chaperone NapD [Billgrantia kenyensis]|uniref:Chaperone NapD n=1 Tax=Billgrantia kenyensis TaxID=321266 RepID=A0A7V9W3X5_9GAMM|nr:chaperone NapD [Halomonas kenyensis]MBA2780522.1 chaperone NapD [Halomonas kenyensis]MCG6663442.1 chaperone NapD [Halomonas kenyensis]